MSDTHEHDHGHTHEHNHDHGHTHTHEHDHDRAPGGPVASKDTALLRYMLGHNRSHAQEMRDIGRSLADAGFGGVSELVESAVLHFERGNEQLREALERLDDGAAPEGKG